MGQKAYFKQFVKHHTIPLESQGLLRHHDTHYHVAPIVLMPPEFANEMIRLVERRQQLLAFVEAKEGGQGPVWQQILSRTTRNVDYMGFLTRNVLKYLQNNSEMNTAPDPWVLDNTMKVFSSFTMASLNASHLLKYQGDESWFKLFTKENPPSERGMSIKDTTQQKKLFKSFQQRWQLLNAITQGLAPVLPIRWESSLNK